MIRTGDVLENPVTGERMIFRQTSADTRGEAVVIECIVQPKGVVAATHVHPSQDERFEVLSGTVGFRIAKQEIDASAGERILIAAGTAHKFWNAGDEEAHFVCEVRPALQFESLIETMFGLAGDGKTNRKGMPNPLRLAVIARAHFDTVRLPFLPAWMQRLGPAMGAPVGRLLGYGAAYERRAGTRPWRRPSETRATQPAAQTSADCARLHRPADAGGGRDRAPPRPSGRRAPPEKALLQAEDDRRVAPACRGSEEQDDELGAGCCSQPRQDSLVHFRPP